MRCSKLLFLVFGILSFEFVMASDFQLIVKPINPFHFGPAQIFNPISIVNNGQAEIELNLKVEVKLQDGSSVASFSSLPYKAKMGMTDLSSQSASLLSVIYQNTTFQSYISENATFPSGQYNYCISAISVDGSGSATSCIDFEIEGLRPATAIQPEDEARIEVLGPSLVQFNWTPCMPAKKSVRYALTVVEVHPNQTALDALTRNPSIHKIDGLGMPYYAYPSTAPALEINKTYAWQIECYEKINVNEITGNKNTAIVSEPYQFTLLKKEEKDTIYFARPLKKLDAGFSVLNKGELYFTFSSDYLQGLLDYAFTNEKNEKVDVKIRRVQDDGKLNDAPIVFKGDNKYVLEFKSEPSPGFYLLELHDLKGLKYYLKVKVN